MVGADRGRGHLELETSCQRNDSSTTNASRASHLDERGYKISRESIYLFLGIKMIDNQFHANIYTLAL